MKTAGFGTSRKYTNIQIYNVKYYKKFAKILLKSFLNLKIHLQGKMSVYVGILLKLL